MRFSLLHTWIPLIPIGLFVEIENKTHDKMAEAVVEDQEESFVGVNEDPLGIQGLLVCQYLFVYSYNIYSTIIYIYS